MSINFMESGSVTATLPPSRVVENAVDPHDLFLRGKMFASLNGVRCICCLAVIKEHVLWTFPGPRLISRGFLGVDLFFVISGFLIVTLLIRERDRRGSVNLARFYARRSLRIFPIYYLVIFTVFAAFLAVSPWKPNGLAYYAASFPVLLFYLQDIIRVPLGNFNPCWTLAMEEQFYLIWPTFERFANRSVRWAILGGMLVLNQAISFGFFDSAIVWAYGDRAAIVMPIYAITFTPILLGVVLAYLLHDARSFRYLYRVLHPRWMPFLLLAVLFAANEVAPDDGRGGTKLALHLIFMMLLGSLVIREDHFARPILTFKPIARLGAISYGLYLYHLWVINLAEVGLHRLDPSGVDRGIVFAVATLGTIVVAEISFRFIEQPLLRFKERFHS